MSKNIIKKKYLKGGILCFALLLSASSLFAEEKITLKCNGKMQTITKDQFYIYNKPLKDQLLADGYNGIYGQDIYYKGNNFVKKIKDELKNFKTKGIIAKDICADDLGYVATFIDNSSYIFTNASSYDTGNEINYEYTNDFFETTHNDKDFNDYFKTKKIKYPFGYAIRFQAETNVGDFKVVKTSNKDYYLFISAKSGKHFLLESKYVDEVIFSKRTGEWSNYKEDGTLVYVDKSIIQDTRDFSFNDKIGYFQTNTFIIEKPVLAEQNGGYKVFNYQGTLELESEEGFLPILKPYKDGEYNVLIGNYRDV